MNPTTPPTIPPMRAPVEGPEDEDFEIVFACADCGAMMVVVKS